MPDGINGSHAFIFAGTISLDSWVACKSRWCLYIYVLPVNLQVPGPHTFSFVTIYNDTTQKNNLSYKQTVVIKTNRTDACAKPCLYIDAPNPTSSNISHQNMRWFIPNKQKILNTLVWNLNDLFILNYEHLTMVSLTYHTQDLVKIDNVTFELEYINF